MKKLTFCIIFQVIAFTAISQKENNTWVFSYKYTFQSFTNGIYFDFGDSLRIEQKIRQMSIAATNASISDKSGNLLLYTNGCYIANGLDEFVENSDGLNPGFAYTYDCSGDSIGYSSNQAALFLPSPKDSTLINLFHVSTFFQLNPLIAFQDKLYYSVVDITANGGHGKVISKNNIIIDDTLHNDGLHAVRHANGRDWWIIIPKSLSNIYFVILFSPNGISYHSQSIGLPTQSKAGGELVFSPDGTKLVRFNAQDDLRILDFDRCSGVLSNPIFIPITDDADGQLYAGLAFSADGHYLYAAEIRRLLQFDMWASDISITKKIVAESVTSADCSLGSAIGYLELGPDGRIYCRPINGQKCMHRIGRPEKPVSECDFVQFYYDFGQGYRSLPQFPNFRLGPIDNSPCDSLGIDNVPYADWRYDRTDDLNVDFISLSSFEPDSWYWEFGDPVSGALNQSTQKNPSHEFSAPGAYESCLTVSNQYGSDTKCKTVWISTTSSTELQENSKVLKIYPNPTTGLVYFSNIDEVLVRVFDNTGCLHLQKEVTGGRLDLSHLQPGIYRLQVFRKSKMPAMQNIVIINR